MSNLIPSPQRIPMLLWDGSDLLFLTSPTRRVRFVNATVRGATMAGAGEDEKGTTGLQLYIDADSRTEEEWSAEQPKIDQDGIVVQGPWGDGS